MSQIAAGWNNAGSLADFAKQPRVEFINYGREEIAGDGFVYEDGKQSCELRWDFMTEAEYNAMLTECGVASAASAKMTLAVPSNPLRAATNYNVYTRQPTGTHDRGKWTNVTVQVYGMTAI